MNRVAHGDRIFPIDVATTLTRGDTQHRDEGADGRPHRFGRQILRRVGLAVVGVASVAVGIVAGWPPEVVIAVAWLTVSGVVSVALVVGIAARGMSRPRNRPDA